MTTLCPPYDAVATTYAVGHRCGLSTGERKVSSEAATSIWPKYVISTRARLLELVAVATAPRRREDDLPAVGGYEAGYWEITLGSEVLVIRKPADPLADMRDIVSRSSTGTAAEELAKIRRAMRDRVRKTRSSS